MKLETVALDDQQTKLIAEFDTETLEKYKRQAARKISQNQKIPGFRPGKAPYDLVRRIIGDETLQQEAVELMLEDVYPQVIKEANLDPSGPGKLEEILKIDPPTFSFVVPLQPAVELGDYQAIRKDYALEPVTDEQVEATIRRLQRSYATAEPVERPAQEGDMVSFKLSAKRTEPEEGKPETLIEETPYQLIAGEDEEDEGAAWPYEGFAKELVGMGANDTKTVRHTFNDESPYEDLRGKEAEYTITVQNIKEMHLPELTDEFAQSLGEFENLEALRSTVRSQLEQNAAQQYDQQYFEEVINQLVEQSTIKYPPHMLDQEIEEFVAGLEKNLERDHLDLETYLKMREMNREDFIEKEVKPAATRRLERSLALEEFAHRENVEVKSEEVRSIYQTALQQLQQTQQSSKAQSRNRRSTQDMANSLAINTVNSIFNQRMMTRLKAIAIGRGDEVEEQAEAMSMSEAAVQPEEMALPPESEAAIESVESSAPIGEREAEEEQADAEAAGAEADMRADEPPQSEQGPEESTESEA